MTRRKEIYNSRLFKQVKNNCTKFMQLIHRSGERHEVSKLRLKSCVDDRNIIYKATITRCDSSPRFFCIDAMLLCEFESDKI